MHDYRYRNGFPYLEIAGGDDFAIRGCMLYRTREGQEIAAWDCWNPQAQVPDDFPVQWARQFWRNLEAAPRFVLSEDQWASHYYSLLGDTVIRWTDDRQQGMSEVHSCVERSEFAHALSTTDAARTWLASL